MGTSHSKMGHSPVPGQAFDGDLDTMSLLIKAGADVNAGVPRIGFFW